MAGWLEATPVVTAFVYRRGRVLLLRRSERVGTYPGRWAGVSGYLERTPLAQARLELKEELGVRADQTSLRGIGIPLLVEDEAAQPPWLVFTFLFGLRADARVRPNWESAQLEWVRPEEVGRRRTVPGLAQGLARVWPPWGRPGFWQQMEGIASDPVRGATDLALEGLRAIGGLPGQARERGSRAYASLHPSMGAFPHVAARALAGDTRLEALREELEAATAASAREAAAGLAGRRRVLTHSASRACREALVAWGARGGEVVVTESRPRREGVGLARELARAGLRVTLISDAQIGLWAPRCDAVLVGADAISDDDYLVNKAGTKLAALAAREAGVPIYAVAQTFKVCPPGWPLALTPQAPSDLARVSGVRVANVVFDATPLAWFDAILTEEGKLTPELLAQTRRRLARAPLLP